MDTHTRVTAILHIVFGAIGAFTMLVAALAIGGVATFIPTSDLPTWLLGFGAAAFLVLALLAAGEAIAGILLLGGNSAARIVVIIYGVLSLWQVPLGTLLGVYTLWALLRKESTSGQNA